LTLVSTDHGPGAPSFGDLFEDPDSPLAPTPAGSEHANDSTAAQPAVREPVAVEPEPVLGRPQPVAVEPEPSVVVVEPPMGEAEDRLVHDLDHESAEASHLVAGFEPADEPAPPQPAPGDGLAGPAVTVAAASADEPVSVAPVARPWDGTVDPAISSAPAGRVDTGRLYRSAGAEGPATLDAIPAIDPSYAPGRRVEVVADKAPQAQPDGLGLTYSGVVVVVGAATVLVAFAEAILRQQIGVATGVALLVSSVYSALVVRRADIWAAVVVPPLAFLAAALTAGQLILDKSGSLVIREGFSLFRILATNAPWILGTTAVCLVIVLVRRRRH
jgi:hypothetical protein